LIGSPQETLICKQDALSVLLEFFIRNRERITVSLLDILYYPDAQLRRTAAAVENVDGKLVALVDHMLETMYDAPGIGLAATQVNVQEMQEGCLSIPGVYETVERPAEIKIAAIDREGNPFEMETDGLLAVCIQHEVDHLNGKLFVDYLSPLKRNRIRKRLEKWIRDGADPDDLPERP